MALIEGKYTINLFAEKKGLKEQSAINLLSKLKKKGLVSVSGGGRQKRIYTIRNKPEVKTNGFYNLINKYSPEKLNPKFKHVVIGNYTTEHAIIDGIKINDVRTKEAITHLFRHVKNWKRLFDLAKKNELTEQVLELYKKARTKTKCRTIPKKYLK